jgi:transcriptional regulator PpsR
LQPFKTPERSLGDLDAEAAATLIAAAADIAIVVDADGEICDFALSNEDLGRELESHGKWIGRSWVDTVTIESRPKIEALLREAASKSMPRWRQVNHPSSRGLDVPVSYSAVQAREDRIVVFGRDLRVVSDLQQRLVDAQQSLERDYSRLRHIETRYRLLFEMSTEAVLILDANTFRVLEANPAARTLLGDHGAAVAGRGFADLFAPEGGSAIQSLLAAIRSASRVQDVRTRLAHGQGDVVVSASQFRQEGAAYVLVRVASLRSDALITVSPMQAKLVKAVQDAPDGFVVTDDDGTILTANGAFLEMAQLPSEEQARGESLERWLGRSGVDVEVLIGSLRQRGSVRLFATSMRGELGEAVDVEVSAVSIVNGGRPCLGFAIRNVGRRLKAPSARAAHELPRSVEQLTELIGRVSLKELVREATDVIERLCIEAALDLTNDNRASAAEMLGLSRQSLYVKLRRYGLGDLAPESGQS